jgi:hypothetical protein
MKGGSAEVSFRPWNHRESETQLHKEEIEQYAPPRSKRHSPIGFVHAFVEDNNRKLRREHEVGELDLLGA